MFGNNIRNIVDLINNYDLRKIFGDRQISLEEARIQRLNLLKLFAIKEIEQLSRNSTSVEMQRIYALVDLNLRRISPHLVEGEYLYKGNGYATYGQNKKRVVNIAGSNVLQSQIDLPTYHLFDHDKLRIEGVMTAMHEFSHIVIPERLKEYIRGRYGRVDVDEFVADAISSKMDYGFGISKNEIQSHLIGRREVVGAPIDLLATNGDPRMREAVRENVEHKNRIEEYNKEGYNQYRDGEALAEIKPRVVRQYNSYRDEPAFTKEGMSHIRNVLLGGFRG